MESAILRGDITWHAGPMNIQSENYPYTLFEYGLSISDQLDSRFNITHKNKVMSQRDVPGNCNILLLVLTLMAANMVPKCQF